MSTSDRFFCKVSNVTHQKEKYLDSITMKKCTDALIKLRLGICLNWSQQLETRMAPDQLASKTYNTKMSGYKARGRPRKTWIEGAKETLKTHNIPPTQAFELAADRKLFLPSTPRDRLVGQVVKASASRPEGPGFESRLRRDFSGIESYQ